MEHIIKLSGRIDTATAASVDLYIADELSQLTERPSQLTIDFTDVSYISSTGLRVILKYRKQVPDLQVVNVSNDIYHVFDMTGFTRMITVKRALRKIDLAKCQPLAHGANGEVFKINDEEIVKLSLFANREQELIEEMNCAHEAFIMGVPTMISFDLVQVNDGRKGIVMEALNSTTLAQHLKQHPEDMDAYMEPYINLFRTTNAIVTQPGQFASAKQHLYDRLLSPSNFMGEELTAGIKALVDALPDGLNLIHADGHPSNALLCGDASSRSLMLIDMGDISSGHPIMEIIGWSFLMNGTSYSPARMIGPMATGLDYDYLQQMYRKMMASYLRITDSATLDRAVQAGAYVGVLRFICIDQVRITDPVKQQRTIGMARQTLEHRQDVLDSIALLTELVAKSGLISVNS